MSGKKFKLEQVLGYRREMEKLRKQEFAAAKRNLEDASEQLRQEQIQVTELAGEFRSRQNELDTIEELRMYNDYFRRKKEDIRRQMERVEQLDQVVSERREDLLDATKDKKVLESLKEKKASEFRLKMLQKEREFMDEISVQKKVEPQ